MRYRPWSHGILSESFDQHSSPVILDMMRSMSYMPSMGLGWRQHGHSESIIVLDHDPPFGLGFVPVEVDFRRMALLCQEKVISRLHHILFDYHIRPYSLRLSDYFVRALEPLLHPNGLIDEPTDIQHAELHHLFFHNFSCAVRLLTLLLPCSLLLPLGGLVCSLCAFRKRYLIMGVLMGLCRLMIMLRSYSRWSSISPSQILHLVIFVCLL